MANPSYNNRKFRELVKYVAIKSSDDPAFGLVKLNKILFYCDFLAYLNLGEPITGAGYHTEPYGPVPDQGARELRKMEEDGETAIILHKFYGRDQKKVAAKTLPDLSVFRSEEIAMADDVLEQLRDSNAAEVSDLSHTFIGWQLAKMGEDIPYETALGVCQEPATDEELEHAKSL